MSAKRAQINLRLPSTLLDRLAISAQRQGISRNALVLRYVQDGLDLDDDTNRRVRGQLVPLGAAGGDAVAIPPRLVGPILAREAEEAEAVAERAERYERQSDKPHRHRFERVPQTEAPGRLLGETEATYECVCGKSERRKVT